MASIVANKLHNRNIKIYNVYMEFVAINKFSLLDYPGKISCILYTRGCNFRCPYCHNGLTLLDNTRDFVLFDDILNFLKKRVGILDGVVISGGEPTLMPDLIEKIIEIKKLGFLVKLDTNGTNPSVLQTLIEHQLIDYVAMDIKAPLHKYAKVTNNSNIDIQKIAKSIEILKSGVVDYEFRTTLVDEFINELDIISIGKTLQGAKRLFLQQYKLSDGVINKNLHHIDEDLAIKFRNILSQYINEVELRGY